MNQFITTDWLSMKAIVLLTNKLEVTAVFDSSYKQEYAKAFAPGETIRVGYTPKFTTTNSLTYQGQGISEIYTTITVNQVVQCGFEWNDIEAALKLERDDKRLTEFYVESPLAQMAQEVDLRSSLFAYQNANQIAGVLGTDPTTFQSFSNLADQKLFEQACPVEGDRMMIVTPSVNTSLVAAAIAYFNPSDALAKQYKKGYIGEQANFQWYRSMSLRKHTAGTIAGAFTLAAAVASGASSMTANMTAADTLFVGDVIGIGSVYNANPMTREQTTTAYTFTVAVTQDVVAAGGGGDVIQFTPTIYGPGSPYQNVDALPANGATLTLFPGTTSPNGKSGKQSLAIHKKAFFYVPVPLELPKNIEIAKQHQDPETKTWIRMTRAWDPIESRMINRFDMLFGYGIQFNNNCVVRLLGA